MKAYLNGIWESRYFWLHLARADLKYKFRRSRLGLLWTMINPLMLMLMITLVFGNLFGISMKYYGSYVFSGILIWDFIHGAALTGCNALLSSESYIKQFQHPMAIYSLKVALVQVATFIIAVQALYIWTLFSNPTNLWLCLLTLPITVVCLFLLGWPIAILTSSINIKYRDFSQILALVLQLLWYMSPIMIKPEMFKARSLTLLFEYNPVTHILNLLRTPLLDGRLPSLIDFAYVLGLAAILFLLAIWRMYRVEKTLVFYF